METQKSNLFAKLNKYSKFHLTDLKKCIIIVAINRFLEHLCIFIHRKERKIHAKNFY